MNKDTERFIEEDARRAVSYLNIHPYAFQPGQFYLVAGRWQNNLHRVGGGVFEVIESKQDFLLLNLIEVFGEWELYEAHDAFSPTMFTFIIESSDWSLLEARDIVKAKQNRHFSNEFGNLGGDEND